MKEIFKDIPNYPKYKVSDLGNVKSLQGKTERILKYDTDKDGYKRASLAGDKFPIHQLVAMVFLDHKRDGMKRVINHINFNKQDNRVVNLEVVSVRENSNKKHIKSSSKYTGVSWHKQHNKWQSNIQVEGIKLYLGLFDNEIDAHLAYEDKLKTLN